MIVVVASFHVPCFSYAPGTIFLRLQLTLPTPQCMYHANSVLKVWLLQFTAEVIPYQEHWKRITKVER